MEKVKSKEDNVFIADFAENGVRLINIEMISKITKIRNHSFPFKIEFVFARNSFIYFHTKCGKLYVIGDDFFGAGILGKGQKIKQLREPTELKLTTNENKVECFACTEDFCVASNNENQLFVWGNMSKTLGNFNHFEKRKYYEPFYFYTETQIDKLCCSNSSIFLLKKDKKSIHFFGTVLNMVSNQEDSVCTLEMSSKIEIIQVNKFGIFLLENNSNLLYISNYKIAYRLAREFKAHHLFFQEQIVAYLSNDLTKMHVFEFLRSSTRCFNCFTLTLPSFVESKVVCPQNSSQMSTIINFRFNFIQKELPRQTNSNDETNQFTDFIIDEFSLQKQNECSIEITESDKFIFNQDIGISMSKTKNGTVINSKFHLSNERSISNNFSYETQKLAHPIIRTQTSLWEKIQYLNSKITFSAENLTNKDAASAQRIEKIRERLKNLESRPFRLKTEDIPVTENKMDYNLINGFIKLIDFERTISLKNGITALKITKENKEKRTKNKRLKFAIYNCEECIATLKIRKTFKKIKDQKKRKPNKQEIFNKLGKIYSIFEQRKLILVFDLMKKTRKLYLFGKIELLFLKQNEMICAYFVNALKKMKSEKIEFALKKTQTYKNIQIGKNQVHFCDSKLTENEINGKKQVQMYPTQFGKFQCIEESNMLKANLTCESFWMENSGQLKTINPSLQSFRKSSNNQKNEINQQEPDETNSRLKSLPEELPESSAPLSKFQIQKPFAKQQKPIIESWEISNALVNEYFKGDSLSKIEIKSSLRDSVFDLELIKSCKILLSSHRKEGEDSKDIEKTNQEIIRMEFAKLLNTRRLTESEKKNKNLKDEFNALSCFKKIENRTSFETNFEPPKAKISPKEDLMVEPKTEEKKNELKKRLKFFEGNMHKSLEVIRGVKDKTHKDSTIKLQNFKYKNHLRNNKNQS